MRALPVSFHFFDLIVITGILQGIIMSVIFYVNPAKEISKNIFSFILLVVSLLSFKILLHTLGLWQLSAFRYFPLGIDTTLAPLFYWYICSVTAKPVNPKKLIVWFLPTICYMSYALAVYGLTLFQPTIAAKDGLATRLLFNPVKVTEDVMAVITAFIFWLLGYRRLQWYRKWLYSTQSDSRLQEFTWLRNLLVVTCALVSALLVIVLAEDWLHLRGFLLLQLFYSYLAVLTYYLALKGYIVHLAGKPNSPTIEPELPAIAASIADQHGEIKHSIVAAMKQGRLFLNPELNLKDLAQYTGYPLAVVSATINGQFNRNFRGLVNYYRTEEVKRLLISPPAHLSLLGIALECGFNSEASFYRIFRQETGMSPSEYLRQV